MTVSVAHAEVLQHHDVCGDNERSMLGRRPDLSSNSPSFECQHNDFPCHDESGQTHHDGEDEHRHQVALVHDSGNVLGAAHENESSSDEAECRDQLRRWSTWVDRSGRRDVGDDIGGKTGE